MPLAHDFNFGRRVPQQGQEAVGEAAYTVTVTSVVTLTCSTTRSERSGSIVIVSSLDQERVSLEILFCPSFYHIAIIEPAREPNDVSNDAQSHAFRVVRSCVEMVFCGQTLPPAANKLWEK